MNKGRLIWFCICTSLTLYGVVGIIYYSTVDYCEPKQYSIDYDNDGNEETITSVPDGLTCSYAYLSDINPHLFVFFMTLFFGWIWLIPKDKAQQKIGNVSGKQ